MNILLIIVDTLRPDHLSINDYRRSTSPNMDNFAKEGTSFLNAYSSLPRTDPSNMSILTGMYPHNHGVRLVHNNKPNQSLSHLPEILQSHGYKTGFMGGSGIHEPVLEKGFGEYNLIIWQIKNKVRRSSYKIFNPKTFLGSAEQFTDIAIKWIKKNLGNKFFLCLHYEDLHWPYDVPQPFENIFDPDYKGNHEFNTLKHGKFSRGELIFGNVKLPKEELQHAIAHYDGGIKYTDNQIGKLMDCLKRENLYEDTLIILTSDHGENFGEHNFYFQHGASLYEPSLKIPLVFRYPKSIPQGKVIEQRVQNVDIMPTLLEMLNIPLIDKIDGVSLLTLIKEKTRKLVSFIFAESIEEHFKGNKRVYFSGVKGKWRAMIEGDWKIIYIPHPENDIFELYNLKDDPNEKNNLIDKEKEKALHMKNKILEFLKLQSNEGDADLSDLTERSKKLLRKLGYLD